ncbi:MAG: thiaminase II, partial [Alphaproteobacteria bacterium]
MPALYSETSLFARLKAACADDWQAYAGHAFVKRLADGTLPEACFRHYLGQDYLFLIHLARAYAL